MSHIYRSSLAILIIVISTVVDVGALCAQWINTDGPYGGYVGAIATDPNDTSLVCVGTDVGGVYVSTDDGITWRQSGNIGGSLTVDCVTFSGSNILAGVPFNGGFFFSTDYGVSWTQGNGISNAQPTCFAVGDSVVYAGTYSGVFVSSDEGADWTQTSSGPGNGIVQCLAVADSDLFAGMNGGGLYVSHDHGATWSEVVNGLGGNSVMCMAVKGTEIYAATGNGVFVTTDDGADWSARSNGLPGGTVYSITPLDSDLVAGGGNGAYVSTDDGLNWSPSDSGLGKIWIMAVSSAGGKVFAGSRQNGVYRSVDGGLTWEHSPLNVPVVSSLALEDTVLYAGTEDGGLYSLHNKLAPWLPVNGGSLQGPDIKSVVVHGQDIYVGTFTWGLYRSTDNGQSWTQLTSSSSGFTSSVVLSLAVDSSNIFVGSGNGVFRSVNDGGSWSLMDNGIPNSGIQDIAVDDSDIFAASGFNLYKSGDAGMSWTKCASGKAYVEGVACSGKDIYFGDYVGDLYASTDGGATWREVNNGLPSSQIHSIAVEDTVVIAGTEKGVYVSPDRGMGWTRAGLPNAAIYSMTTGDSDLFAGTNIGVWEAPLRSLSLKVLTAPVVSAPQAGSISRYDSVDISWNKVTGAAFYRMQLAHDSNFVNLALDTSSIVRNSFLATTLHADTTYYLRVSAWDSSGASAWSGTRKILTSIVVGVVSRPTTPKSYALFQNYPNPFNPSTVIGYQLAAVSHVSLKVYDVLGRVVGTLVNKVESPGSYKVEFNAADLPSGVYFYRLDSGNYSKTMKCLLLK